MGCSYSKNPRKIPGYEEPAVLAAETHFTVDEVEGLFDLFINISSSIIDDGVIQKEEFQLAIFRDRTRRNLFADRIFDMIDFKRNGVIEFGEFVRSLSVFHPAAPMAEKIEFAYNFYDVRHTGFIEKEELKVMVLAMLHESELELEDDMVDAIVNKTFDEADTKSDGKIDPEEWNVFVLKHPSTINNMTLPYLMDINTVFTSFHVGSVLKDSDMY